MINISSQFALFSTIEIVLNCLLITFSISITLLQRQIPAAGKSAHFPSRMPRWDIIPHWLTMKVIQMWIFLILISDHFASSPTIFNSFINNKAKGWAELPIRHANDDHECSFTFEMSAQTKHRTVQANWIQEYDPPMIQPRLWRPEHPKTNWIRNLKSYNPPLPIRLSIISPFIQSNVFVFFISTLNHPMSQMSTLDGIRMRRNRIM